MKSLFICGLGFAAGSLLVTQPIAGVGLMAATIAASFFDIKTIEVKNRNL